MRLQLLKIILMVVIATEANAQKKDYYSSLIGTNSEPELFNAINMNSYELLTTSLQASKDQSLQKIVFAPFKLKDAPSQYFEDTKMNLAQKDGITTIGVGWGIDNASTFSNRGTKKFKAYAVNFQNLGTEPLKRNGESDFAYQQRVDEYNRWLDALAVKYYEELIKNSFKFTIAYNASLFGIIGGDEVDQDLDGIIDNEHHVESNAFSLNTIFTFDAMNSISLNGHYIVKRAGPEEGKKLIPSLGGSFAFAVTLCKLDPKYQTSPDYLKSLFIPSIVFGTSIEYLKALDNEEFAKDGIDKSLVITPFLDFKINPKAQFRIGLPITNKHKTTDEKSVSLGPILQFTLQVADTK